MRAPARSARSANALIGCRSRSSSPPRGRSSSRPSSSARGASAWSHDLLTDPERVLLRRISVFSGGIPLDAIGPVCDPEGTLGMDPVDAAASLVDKSLLTRTEGGDEVRFGMLVTIREFGLEQLEAAGERAAIR